MPDIGSLGAAAGELGAALKAQEMRNSATPDGESGGDNLAYVLTNMAEHGKGVVVEQFMFGLSAGQRVDMLREMDRINEEHRKTNHNLPDLVISYDKHHYEIALDLPGKKDDKVIWSATTDKNDKIVDVLARNGKDYRVTPDAAIQGTGGGSGSAQRPGDVKNGGNNGDLNDGKIRGQDQNDGKPPEQQGGAKRLGKAVGEAARFSNT